MAPSDPHRHRMPSPVAQFDRLTKWQRLGVLWVLGIVALSIVTLVCFQFHLNFATVSAAFFVVIVLLSLLDSFASSAFFSIVAILSLNYFFVEPLYTLDVTDVQDIAAMIAFLVCSLAVTGLVRRLRHMAELRREEARLIELTNDAFISRDASGAITYWNRGAEELYGWRRDEVLGKNAQDVLRPTEPDVVTQVDQMMLTSGRWEGELVHHRRDGTQIHVATRWSMRKDERGQLLSILESNSDITERKRTEDIMRRSQAAYLAEAQKLSRTGSFGWNPATGETHWSDETFRIFGYELAPSASIAMVLERVHPDDAAEMRQIIERAAAEREGFDHEHRLLMPDGSVKYVRAVAHLAPGEQEPPTYIGAVSDITESKGAYAALERSEQRYRNVFQHMPIGLIQLDLGGVLELMNRLRAEGVADIGAYLDENPDFVERAMDALTIEAANEHTARMFGAQNPFWMAGPATRYLHLPPETARRKVEGHFRGDLLFEEETKMTTVDGRDIQVLLTIARSGALAEKSLAGLIDITDRVAAQEMLSSIQADFAHASRVSVLGELTASIAHEINQPLAAISANGEVGLRWLSRPDPDLGELREVAESVVADARRAADIISRIRAMAGRKTPERVLFSLDEIIAEALLFLRHEIQTRGVTVSQHFATTGLQVFGDRIQLQQVIVNLAVNSMQAMALAQSPVRRLIIYTSAPDATSVRCTIEDTGPGIKPEHLGRMFESFFTTKEGGMGMGLPICRSIIEAHGGRIIADNDRAGGASFTFTLPIAAEED
jgi:PAS domain S-box-containing protein